MELAVCHRLPGRVQLHVPQLCRQPAVADAVVAAVRDQPGIKSALLNSACGLIKQNYAIVAGLNTLAVALALPGGLISPTVTESINDMRPVLRYQ